MQKLILGTRGSKLALRQAQTVAREIQSSNPAVAVELRTVKTQGDKILDTALSRIGDKGLFTKEIEKELLAGRIDLAVHSMKDIPVEMEAGLCIGAVLQREDPRDVLLSFRGYRFHELPPEALVGTSSLRRIAQLKSWRPDLRIFELRGNVETRIRKMQENELDAIVLAWAGVKRLELESRVSDFFPAATLLPAVGQGAIAVQVRAGDRRTAALLQPINHTDTFQAVTAERVLLRELQGGCQVPIGCWAQIQEGRMRIQGMVASLDGGRCCRQELEGPADKGPDLARELAGRLLDQGARAILDEIRKSMEKPSL